MSSVMVILCPNSVGHTAPKSVQISPYSVRMRENTDQKKNAYLDTFHAVSFILRKKVYFCRSLWTKTLGKWLGIFT